MTSPPAHTPAVAAVVVCFHPDQSQLRAQVRALAAQCRHVIVVDNTPAPNAVAAWLAGERCELMAQGRNVGLAHAHNEGIRRARELAAEFVLLMDQDSSPASDMVAHLLDGYTALTAAGTAVAAVGPQWIDRHSNAPTPFIRLGWLLTDRYFCGNGAPVIECDTLVSSGSLIPLAVIDQVGPMDGALFIDQIDIEWGLRAQRGGYRLFGICAAKLAHGIGDRSVRVWFLRWRRVSVHAPVRDYYIARNIVAVFFRGPAPLRWRLFHLRLLLGLMFVNATQVPPRLQRLKMALAGIVDGWRGRLGSFEEARR